MAKFNQKETLNYSALTKELAANGPRTLYMLWGPEDYLIADFTARLRNACLEGGAGDFDAKRLDGPLPSAEELAQALDAMPFFGGRTFLELRGFDVNRCRDEKIAGLLGDIPDWCTVVITLPADTTPDGRLSLVKQIKKDGKAVEFTAQDDIQLYRWIQKRFAAHGKSIGREAMDRLMFLSGDLMNRLIPEIEKVSAYASGDTVTVEDVEAVAHHIPEAQAFAMTDCIAAHDYNGAASILAELLAGDSEPLEIMGALGWQMRQLYAAKVASEMHKGPLFAREILGIGSDYRLRKLMESAGRFTLSALTNDVRLCAEYCMKAREQGASMTDEEALTELLIRFAMESRHA